MRGPEEKGQVPESSSSLIQFTYSKRKEDIIGEGQTKVNGPIYRGAFNNVKVAVKISSSSEERILNKLNHPNIVKNLYTREAGIHRCVFMFGFLKTLYTVGYSVMVQI